MERRRNDGAGEAGDPREDPPTNGIVRHDSHLRKSDDPAGDWGPGVLIALPPWPWPWPPYLSKRFVMESENGRTESPLQRQRNKDLPLRTFNSRSGNDREKSNGNDHLLCDCTHEERICEAAILANSYLLESSGGLGHRTSRTRVVDASAVSSTNYGAAARRTLDERQENSTCFTSSIQTGRSRKEVDDYEVKSVTEVAKETSNNQLSAHECGALLPWCNLPGLVKLGLHAAEEYPGRSELKSLALRACVPDLAGWRARGLRETTGDPPRKPPPPPRHDSHLRKYRSDPAGDRARFTSVGGEQSNRSATAAPTGVRCQRSVFFFFFSRLRPPEAVVHRIATMQVAFCRLPSRQREGRTTTETGKLEYARKFRAKAEWKRGKRYLQTAISTLMKWRSETDEKADANSIHRRLGVPTSTREMSEREWVSGGGSEKDFSVPYPGLPDSPPRKKEAPRDTISRRRRLPDHAPRRETQITSVPGLLPYHFQAIPPHHDILSRSWTSGVVWSALNNGVFESEFDLGSDVKVLHKRNFMVLDLRFVDLGSKHDSPESGSGALLESSSVRLGGRRAPYLLHRCGPLGVGQALAWPQCRQVGRGETTWRYLRYVLLDSDAILLAREVGVRVVSCCLESVSVKYSVAWLCRDATTRSHHSPPAKANQVRFPAGLPPGDFRTWESCQTMQLVGGFSRGSPAFPRPCVTALLLTHISSAFIGSQGLDVNRRPKLSTLQFRTSFEDNLDVKHVHTGVTFTIGSQFIRRALDDSGANDRLVRKQVANSILSESDKVQRNCKTIKVCVLHAGAQRNFHIDVVPCIYVHTPQRVKQGFQKCSVYRERPPENFAARSCPWQILDAGVACVRKPSAGCSYGCRYRKKTTFLPIGNSAFSPFVDSTRRSANSPRALKCPISTVEVAPRRISPNLIEAFSHRRSRIRLSALIVRYCERYRRRGVVENCCKLGSEVLCSTNMPILTAHWLSAVTVEGDNWASVLQEVSNTVWTKWPQSGYWFLLGAPRMYSSELAPAFLVQRYTTRHWTEVWYDSIKAGEQTAVAPPRVRSLYAHGRRQLDTVLQEVSNTVWTNSLSDINVRVLNSSLSQNESANFSGLLSSLDPQLDFSALAYWSLRCVFIGCCHTPGGNGIRKVFPCTSAIGSEECRAGLINSEPIAKASPTGGGGGGEVAAHFLIGCERFWERALCLTGYCVLEIDSLLAGRPTLASTLPRADWQMGFRHEVGMLARKHLAKPITARCGATTNEHTAEAPVCRGLRSLAYRSLNSRKSSYPYHVDCSGVLGREGVDDRARCPRRPAARERGEAGATSRMPRDRQAQGTASASGEIERAISQKGRRAIHQAVATSPGVLARNTALAFTVAVRRVGLSPNHHSTRILSAPPPALPFPNPFYDTPPRLPRRLRYLPAGENRVRDVQFFSITIERIQAQCT
ncbi:hypothetical protein PR048_004370 [Dryococelus australis]|uniref:Uncharacterized protein n=1 Tax=Dryococelus australis TaxID=614101 RepID=A0ABQ9I634_9NEOP|nr:hypothetical protein PR048_004370 [Dryococelus australis]